MKLKELEQSNLDKLRQVRRRTVQVSQENLIRTRYFSPDQPLPLVVEPNVADVALGAWASKNLDWIEQNLLKHGGLLFRGFKVDSPEAFSSVVNTICPDLLNYVEGSSPRIVVHDKVYTSTEYPPEYFVSMHNELSYAHKWPSKIFFFCLKAAPTGGETPIADSRLVLQRIDPKIRERFEQKRLIYRRKLHGGRGAGLAWQTVFETDDKAKVEAYCREGNIHFEWTADGGLRTSQTRPAVITHPKTGEKVWFNQVDQWHPSNLEDEVRKGLLATTAVDDLPIYSTFGDGAPLDDAELDHVRQVFRDTLVAFPWQEGDVLIGDNTLIAHGRMPFEGPRRVLVAMGGAVRLQDVGENP